MLSTRENQHLFICSGCETGSECLATKIQLVVAQREDLISPHPGRNRENNYSIEVSVRWLLACNEQTGAEKAVAPPRFL